MRCCRCCCWLFLLTWIGSALSFPGASCGDGEDPDPAPPEQQPGALHLHQRALEAVPAQRGAAQRRPHVYTETRATPVTRLSIPHTPSPYARMWVRGSTSIRLSPLVLRGSTGLEGGLDLVTPHDWKMSKARAYSQNHLQRVGSKRLRCWD